MSPLLFALALATPADRLTVTGGPADALNVVVKVPLPKAAAINAMTLPSGQHVPVQVVPAGLHDAPAEHGYAVFVLPALKAGEGVSLVPTTLNYVKVPPAFAFAETPGEHVDLVYDKTPVLRYVNKPRDGASKESHYLSFKPFHQVFDPADGKTMLSSGAHPNTKEYQFPHHRGLFYGWNKITYGDKKAADIWHGHENVFSTHDKMLSTAAGEVVGRHTAAISWHGKDGATFATEEREVAVAKVTGGTLIDWSSKLTTDLPKVRLDGDPQHAGFHFRATQEVSKSTAKQTYYLRPDGKGKPGETRNWDAKGKNPRAVNLPWNAMCFQTGGKTYTALRINHPDNPKDARGSERDYGRFGDYFEYDLTPATPLAVKYRVWVQEGEMTGDQCAAMAAGFVQVPAVK